MQYTVNLSLDQLAQEMVSQVPYSEVIEFIFKLEECMADSEITKQLYCCFKNLVEEDEALTLLND